MRISDWSSDVCSSDLLRPLARIEERILAQHLGLRRVVAVEFVRFRLELLVERLGDVDHLFELAHRFPHLAALDVDRRIVHEQLVLAVRQRGQDAADMRLRAAVLCKIIVDLAAEDLVEKAALRQELRSEEHTSELQSLMRISYAVFCLKKKKYNT